MTDLDDTIWEYTFVRDQVNNVPDIVENLNKLGSVGWEVCGWTFADQTLGLNALVAILRRRIPAPYAPPGDPAPGWHPDPTERFEIRYWDGRRWTGFASTGGVQSIDYPTKT